MKYLDCQNRQLQEKKCFAEEKKRQVEASEAYESLQSRRLCGSGMQNDRFSDCVIWYKDYLEHRFIHDKSSVPRVNAKWIATFARLSALVNPVSYESSPNMTEKVL